MRYTVKSLKAYGVKIYGVSTFINMLNLRIAKINQLTALNIYLSDINEFAEEKNKYYIENIWKQKRIYKPDSNYNRTYEKGKINIKPKEREFIVRLKFIINN